MEQVRLIEVLYKTDRVKKEGKKYWNTQKKTTTTAKVTEITFQ